MIRSLGGVAEADRARERKSRTRGRHSNIGTTKRGARTKPSVQRRVTWSDMTLLPELLKH